MVPPNYGYSVRFLFDGHEFSLTTTSPISCCDAWYAIGKFFCECVDQSQVTHLPNSNFSEGGCCLDV